MSNALAPIRRTAHDREARRVRILALIQGGHSYEEIGRAENLSAERVRQIVVKSLSENIVEPALESRVQIARLEPALRLAAGQIAAGQLNAIGPLLRVLAQLDKYGAVAAASSGNRENIRERLLAKLDRVAERMRQTGTTPYPTGEKSLESSDSGLESGASL